jgi:hypothetical protein
LNLLFLSPHFPPGFWLFCRALAERGVRVLGVGDAHPSTLAPTLSRHLVDYSHVPDMNRVDDVIAAARHLVSRHGELAAVESHNEHWLGLEARVRAALGVPGPTPDDVDAWRSKSRMGERFQVAGLDPPRSAPVHGPGGVRAFVQAHGLPVVVKPDVGVGGAGARAARDEAELASILEGDLSGAVVQEQLVGDLLTFDGLCAADGSIVFASSFRYAAGVLEFSRDRLDVVYHARRSIAPAVAAAGERAVRAFDLRSRFFHVEVFELPDGRVRPLEINVRPPGGWSIDLMNFAADVDLYRMWAAIVAGERVEPVPLPHRYFAAHVGRRAEVRYRLSMEEVARLLGPALMAVPDVPPIFGEVMGVPIVLLRHADEAELMRLVGSIVERA